MVAVLPDAGDDVPVVRLPLPHKSCGPASSGTVDSPNTTQNMLSDADRHAGQLMGLADRSDVVHAEECQEHPGSGIVTIRMDSKNGLTCVNKDGKSEAASQSRQMVLDAAVRCRPMDAKIETKCLRLLRADGVCARSLGRFLFLKAHLLAFTQVIKASLDGTPMEEVFLSSRIANESEPLVVSDAFNGASCHARLLVNQNDPETKIAYVQPLTNDRIQQPRGWFVCLAPLADVP
jgi:hypothetical protein